PHSGKTHSHSSRADPSPHQQQHHQSPARRTQSVAWEVAASLTADGSRVTADCALDVVILAWVGDFPPATNGGTLSLDLRGREVHDTRSASPPPRLHINDAHREKR